ncbi:hypothetical protein B0H14DRAFT_311110 [Mycena olivaceomarginata]|nr:hypothetical protein B0H14DRAFT_311110 [Mycena olivaceomarginata]
MHDIATPMPTATMHALHRTPQHSWRSRQPPLLSLHAELLELVVLHFVTRPPTQPSANTTLGIESHAQLVGSPTSRCKPMTGFLKVEAGLRAPAARPSLSTYACLLSHPLLLPPCAPYRRRWLQAGSSSRLCSSSGPTRSSCASRPASSMHRFPRDARLHRFRVCTPPMLTACIPIATFDVTGRVADHELYPAAPHDCPWRPRRFWRLNIRE